MTASAMSSLPPPGNAGGQSVEYADNRLLIDLCGEFDRNLAEIERKLLVQIARRGNRLVIHGDETARRETVEILDSLYERLEAGSPVGRDDVDRALRMGAKGSATTADSDDSDGSVVRIGTRGRVVEPRTEAQRDYVRSMLGHELAFGIGPAGTGKTYLAVAVGVSMFAAGQVERIVLSRPAVEAGEKLGYLPGDMKEKVDPYMQPLYDALNDLLPQRQLERHLEQKRIEIAPLAFMRGRTLTDSFVVLDEAQNATPAQMKMFLTRMGEGTRMVVTGDRTQVDLPKGMASGLHEAERILASVPGVAMNRFTSADVVRHPLVARILDAYEADG